MNKKLSELWAQAAANPGTPIDIGRLVICDSCDADYTHSPKHGGMVFGSRGICPECMPRWMALIEEHGEQFMIKATCPPNCSYADFIRAYRGADNTIMIGPLKRKQP